MLPWRTQGFRLHSSIKLFPKERMSLSSRLCRNENGMFETFPTHVLPWMHVSVLPKG